MKPRFAVIGMVVLLLVAVSVSPAFAGWHVQGPFWLDEGEAYGPMWIDGLHLVRITAGCEDVGESFTLYLQYYTGSGWTTISSFICNSLESSYTWDVNPVTANTRSQIWRIQSAAGSDIAFIRSLEFVDVYGDPAYSLSQTTASIQSGAFQSAFTVTDTLDSGNTWALSRSFTYGDITSAITMGALALLSFLGLVSRVVFTRAT